MTAKIVELLQHLIANGAWVTIDRYLEESGDTAEAVHTRRYRGIWQDGVHCNKPEGAGIWVNLPAVREWWRTRPQDARTTLYRHYDAADRLLYVGIAGCERARRQAHKSQSPWFPLVSRTALEEFETRTLALKAERAAIKAERPIYNVHGRR
jgi:hypothetical protein